MKQTLGFVFKTRQEIKYTSNFQQEDRKFSKLLPFQETRQILVALTLHIKWISSLFLY